MLAFEFSAPAVARGGQAILSDLHLDWNAPPYLDSRPALGAGGEFTGKSYGEYSDSAEQFLQALLEVYIEGDGSARAFRTPRVILHLSRGFEERSGRRAVLELAYRFAVERGGLTIAFDRDVEGAFLRRYGILEPDAATRVENHALRSSQFQTVSLNLPRVTSLGDQVKVFEELTRLMEQRLRHIWRSASFGEAARARGSGSAGGSHKPCGRHSIAQAELGNTRH
jgi:ribonucleoside-triphosphate reductase